MTGLLGAFLLRVITTAAIVLAVTLTVERAGPRLGGAVAGLPIVLGPGLAFLALTLPPEALAEAASFALLSLTATQAFLLAHALAARRLSPLPTLALAVAGWAAAAAALALLTEAAPGVMSGRTAGPLAAAALFLVATALIRGVLGALRPPQAAPPRGAGVAALLLRAGLAGLLVGVVTLAAGVLGPRAAGLLLAFPVGMVTIALSLHQRLGAGATIATLHAAALGMSSLAAFCLITALAAPALPLWAALTLALAGSASVSGALAWRARSGGQA